MEDKSGGCNGALEIVLKGGGPWGFSIKGGTESNSFLYISKLCENGIAQLEGQLKEGDILIKINGIECYSKWEAVQLIRSAFQTLSLVVWRGSANLRKRASKRLTHESAFKDKDYKDFGDDETESCGVGGGVKLASYHFRPISFSEFSTAGESRHNQKDTTSSPHIQEYLSYREGEDRVRSLSEETMEKVTFLNFLHFPSSHHASHPISSKNCQSKHGNTDPRPVIQKRNRPSSALVYDDHGGTGENGTSNARFIKNGKQPFANVANRASKRTASRAAKILGLGSSFSFSSNSASCTRTQPDSFDRAPPTNSKSSSDIGSAFRGSKYFGHKGDKLTDPRVDNFHSSSYGSMTQKSYGSPRDEMPISFCESGGFSRKGQGSLGNEEPYVTFSPDRGHFRRLPEDSFRAFTPIQEFKESAVLPDRTDFPYHSKDPLYQTVLETKLNRSQSCELGESEPHTLATVSNDADGDAVFTNLYENIPRSVRHKVLPKRPPLPHATRLSLNTARNRSPLSTNLDVSELFFEGGDRYEDPSDSIPGGTVDTGNEVGIIPRDLDIINVGTKGGLLPEAMDFSRYFNDSGHIVESSVPSCQVTSFNRRRVPSPPSNPLEGLSQNDSDTSYGSSCTNLGSGTNNWGSIKTKPGDVSSSLAKSDSNLHHLVRNSAKGSHVSSQSPNNEHYDIFGGDTRRRGDSLRADAANHIYLDNCDDRPGEVGGESGMHGLEAISRKYIKASKFYSLQGLRKLGMASKTIRATGNSIKYNRILGALYEKSVKSSVESNLPPAKASSASQPSLAIVNATSVASLNAKINLTYNGSKHNQCGGNDYNIDPPYVCQQQIKSSKALTCSKNTSRMFVSKKKGTFLPTLSSIFKPISGSTIPEKVVDIASEHPTNSTHFLPNIDSVIESGMEVDVTLSPDKYESNAKQRGRSTWTEKYRKIWLNEEYDRMKRLREDDTSNNRSPPQVEKCITGTDNKPYESIGRKMLQNSHSHHSLFRVITEPSAQDRDSLSKFHPSIRMGVGGYKPRSSEEIDPTNRVKERKPIPSSFNADIFKARENKAGQIPLIDAEPANDPCHNYLENGRDSNLSVIEPLTVVSYNVSSDHINASTGAIGDIALQDEYHIYENLCPSPDTSKNDGRVGDVNTFDSILSSLDNILNAQMTEKTSHATREEPASPNHVEDNYRKVPNESTEKPNKVSTELTQTLESWYHKPRQVEPNVPPTWHTLPLQDECQAGPIDQPPKFLPPSDDSYQRKNTVVQEHSSADTLATSISQSPKVHHTKQPPTPTGPCYRTPNSKKVGQRYSSYHDQECPDLVGLTLPKDPADNISSPKFTSQESSLAAVAAPTANSKSSATIKMATISEASGIRGSLDQKVDHSSRAISSTGLALRRKYYRQCLSSDMPEVGNPLGLPQDAKKEKVASGHGGGRDASPNEAILDRHKKKRRDPAQTQVQPGDHLAIESKSPQRNKSKLNNTYYFPHIDAEEEPYKSSYGHVAQNVSKREPTTSPLTNKQTPPGLGPKPRGSRGGFTSTTVSSNPIPNSPKYSKPYCRKEEIDAPYDGYNDGFERFASVDDNSIKSRYQRYYNNRQNLISEDARPNLLLANSSPPPSPHKSPIAKEVPLTKSETKARKGYTNPSYPNPNPTNNPNPHQTEQIYKGGGIYKVSSPTSNQNQTAGTSTPPSRSDSGYCSWDNGYAAPPTLTNPNTTSQITSNVVVVRKSEVDYRAVRYGIYGGDQLAQPRDLEGNLEDLAMHDGKRDSSGSDILPREDDGYDYNYDDPLYVNNNDSLLNSYYSSASHYSTDHSSTTTTQLGPGVVCFSSPKPPRVMPRLRQARPDVVPFKQIETNGFCSSNISQSSPSSPYDYSDSIPSPVSDRLTPLQNHNLLVHSYQHHHHVRQKSQEEKDFEILSQEFSKMTTNSQLLEILTNPSSGWMDGAVAKLYHLFGMSYQQINTDGEQKWIDSPLQKREYNDDDQASLIYNSQAEICSQMSSKIKVKREELMVSVIKKMNALKCLQANIETEMQAGDIKWQQLMVDILNIAKPNEIEKIKLYFDDLEKIICLLLSLSLRVTKAVQKLDSLNNPNSQVVEDKKLYESKKEKLEIQYNEALKLKESIDRRGLNVESYFNHYLSSSGRQAFHDYSKARSKLIIDKRHIVEKIKLGEEQMSALEFQNDL